MPMLETGGGRGTDLSPPEEIACEGELLHPAPAGEGVDVYAAALLRLVSQLEASAGLGSTGIAEGRNLDILA